MLIWMSAAGVGSHGEGLSTNDCEGTNGQVLARQQSSVLVRASSARLNKQITAAAAEQKLPTKSEQDCHPAQWYTRKLMVRHTHPAASQADKHMLHKALQLVAEALKPQLKPSPAFRVT